MPLAWSSAKTNPRRKLNLHTTDTKSSAAVVPKSRAPAQQHQNQHALPPPAEGGGALLSVAGPVTPPKDPFRVDDRLLKPVNAQQEVFQYRKPGGRGLGADDQRNLPRASDLAQSASTFPAPGSIRPPGTTPSRKKTVSHGSARKTTPSVTNTPRRSTISTSHATTPAAYADVVPTSEDLAAFARTPKIPRTPPKSTPTAAAAAGAAAATTSLPPPGAGLFPAEVEETVAAQQPFASQVLGEQGGRTTVAATSASQAVSSDTMSSMRVAESAPTTYMGSTGAAHNSDFSAPAKVLATTDSSSRLGDIPRKRGVPSATLPSATAPAGATGGDPREFAGTAAGTNIASEHQTSPAVGAAGTAAHPLSRDCNEPSVAAEVFGRSNKVARTPPPTGEKPARTSLPFPSRTGTDVAMPGGRNYIDDEPTAHSQRRRTLAIGGGAEHGTGNRGDGTADKAPMTKVTTAAETVAAMGARCLVEERPPAGPQEPREAVATVAMRGTVLRQDSVPSRPPAGRYISPMPRETSGEDNGLEIGGFRATLTPAAFQGLASGMRTPNVEAERNADLTEKARPMRSFDPHSSQHRVANTTTIAAAAATTDATTEAQQQQYVPLPPSRRLTAATLGSFRNRRSSVAEAAEAAAAAAAKKKANAALAAAAATAAAAKKAREGEAGPSHEPSATSQHPSVDAVTGTAGEVVNGSSSAVVVSEMVGGIHGLQDNCGVNEAAGESDIERVSVGVAATASDGDDGDARAGEEGDEDNESDMHVGVAETQPLSARVADIGQDTGGTCVTTSASAASSSSSDSPAEGEEGKELGPEDPFARSNRVAHTPTGLLSSNPSSCAVPESIAIAPPTAEAEAAAAVASGGEDNGHSGTCTNVSATEAMTMLDDSPGVEESPEITACKETVTVDGGQSAVAVVAQDPFASRSKLPRTPVEASSEVVEGPSTTDDERQDSDPTALGACERVDVGATGEGLAGAGPRTLLEAQLEIGELHLEVACMADRLAKQSDERNRLAEVAFKAQDEAASLRQKLEQHQRQSNVDTSTSGRDEQQIENIDGHGTPMARGDGGGEGDGAAEAAAASTSPDSGAAGMVMVVDPRVVELELEKREYEVQKEAAEREARENKRELEEAQAKVRELAEREEFRREEWLEEKYKQAQAKCVEDDRRIAERKIKKQVVIADGKAQLLRDKILQEEEARAERVLHEAAGSLTMRAAAVLKAFSARNKRMAGRVVALRACVEESEQRVVLLTAKSKILENVGLTANEEASAVRQELKKAREALVLGKVHADEISERLRKSEEEHCQAQQAQDDLRALVAAEETRRVSVERRLSEVKRTGETNVSIERARRQSTERRLGVAEQTRDDLAVAAAAAAGPALRAAADAERARRESAERRLALVERSSVAAEAERARRLSTERRLDAAEREKAELSVAAAAAAASAASAADAAREAAAATIAATAAAEAAAAIPREEGGRFVRSENEAAGAARHGASVGPLDGKRRRGAKKNVVGEETSSIGEGAAAAGRGEARASESDRPGQGEERGDGLSSTVAGVEPKVSSGGGTTNAVALKKITPKTSEGRMLMVPGVGEGSSAGKVPSKGKKRGVAKKGEAKTVDVILGVDVVDQGMSGSSSSGDEFDSRSVAERPRKAVRREQAKQIESHEDHVSDDENEPSPADVDAFGSADEISMRKSASVADDAPRRTPRTTLTTAAAATARAAKVTKNKKKATTATPSGAKITEAAKMDAAPDTDGNRNGGQAIARARPRRAVPRPSYVEADESPLSARRGSAGGAGVRSGSHSVVSTITPCSSDVEADDESSASFPDVEDTPPMAERRKKRSASAVADVTREGSIGGKDVAGKGTRVKSVPVKSGKRKKNDDEESTAAAAAVAAAAGSTGARKKSTKKRRQQEQRKQPEQRKQKQDAQRSTPDKPEATPAKAAASSPELLRSPTQDNKNSSTTTSSKALRRKSGDNAEQPEAGVAAAKTKTQAPSQKARRKGEKKLEPVETVGLATSDNVATHKVAEDMQEATNKRADAAAEGGGTGGNGNHHGDRSSGLKSNKGRRGSGVGPASGRAKRKLQVEHEAAKATRGGLGVSRGGNMRKVISAGDGNVEEEIAGQSESEGGSEDSSRGMKSDQSAEETISITTAAAAATTASASWSPSQRLPPAARKKTAKKQKRAEEGNENAAPPSPPQSSVAPPRPKRGRKLLGAGAARCRTPKMKAKSAMGEMDAGGVVSVTGAVGGGFRTSMGSVASSFVSGGVTGVRGGVDGAAARGGRASLTGKKGPGTSALSMRSKSRNSIRGSFFQDFLNPQNGFKVPKLKSDVQ